MPNLHDPYKQYYCMIISLTIELRQVFFEFTRCSMICDQHLLDVYLVDLFLQWQYTSSVRSYIPKLNYSQGDVQMYIQHFFQQISEQKIEVEIVIRQLCKERAKLDETEQAIETELSSVEPIMKEATEAVDNINREALSELGVLPMPPGVVKDILGAVLKLLGTSDASWSEMRR